GGVVGRDVLGTVDQRGAAGPVHAVPVVDADGVERLGVQDDGTARDLDAGAAHDARKGDGERRRCTGSSGYHGSCMPKPSARARAPETSASIPASRTRSWSSRYLRTDPSVALTDAASSSVRPRTASDE